MAIRDIVTRGFGNGTYSGTIALVVTRGYAIASGPVIPTPGAGVGVRVVVGGRTTRWESATTPSRPSGADIYVNEPDRVSEAPDPFLPR